MNDHQKDRLIALVLNLARTDNHIFLDVADILMDESGSGFQQLSVEARRERILLTLKRYVE